MDNPGISPEMLVKAKTAASAEELTTMAKAYGVELDVREARKLFAALHERAKDELSESELDKVAGGSIERPDIPGSNKPGC